MKTNSYSQPSKYLPLQFCQRLALASLLLMAGAPGVKAATGADTWNGAAGNNNWNTAGNWAGGSANTPPAAEDTPTFGTQGAGSLTLNNDITAATSFLGLTFNASAPSFVLNGNSISTTGGIADNSPNLETVNLPIILVGTHTVSAVSGGTLVLGGIIDDAASGAGITKTGNGTVVLTNNNTYIGPTTINAGKLTLDFAAAPASIISSSSALTLGGGTLFVKGNSTPSTESFASTALSPGASTIAQSVNNPTINLGAFTTPVGGTVVFTDPAYSTAPTTASGQTGSVGNADPVTGLQAATATITTTSGTSGQVLQSTASGTAGYFAYGTVGLYDFAAQSASGIVGYSQVTGGTGNDGGYYCQTAGFDFNNAVHQDHYEDIANSFNLPSANTTSVGGYRYNASAAVTTGLRGVQSATAILVTPNVGANNVTIGQGSGGGNLAPGLRGGNAGTLVIYQNNLSGFLTFTVLLVNGKTAGGVFLKTGAGTAVFSAVDTYTGPTYLNGGVVEITANSAFGSGSAASVNFAGGTLLGNANFTLDNGSTATARGIALGNFGGGLAAVSGFTVTVDGVISNSLSGTGPLAIGIPASSANGNVAGLLPGTGAGTANTTPVNATGTVLLNAANTYTGGTILQSGAVNINGINALGGANYGGLTFNGGTVKYATAFSGNGSGDLTSIGTAGITVASGGGTIDLNGNAVTYAGSIGNGGSGALTVSSSALGGTLTLSGANTYTGGTTVSSGALIANNSAGSATGSGNVTVASGATLGGTGTISGNVNWQSGSLASYTKGSPLTVGVVTLNNNSVTVNVPGVTPLPVGTYTLMNYTASGSTGAFNAGAPTYTGAGVAAGTISTVSTSGGMVTLGVVSSGVSAAWANDVDGNWSDGTKWSSNPSVPHAAGDAATLGAGTALRTITLNANETVGGIAMTNPNSFVIAASGANVLTLDNTGAGAALNVTAGTANAIQPPVSLKDNAVITVNGGQSLAFSGIVSNGPSVTKTLTLNGAGTTVLSGANTYGPASGTPGTALSGGGTLQAANNSALGAGDLSVGGIGGTLQAGVPALNLANKIAIGSALTVDNNGNDITLGGDVSGTGTLTKTGNHTLTLNGNNLYSGVTTVNGGVLKISSAGNVQNTPTIILNGGDLLGNASFAENNNIGIGPVVGAVGATGFLDAASAQTFTVNGVIASAGNTGVNNLTVNSVATTPGTVVLASANTFGGTTVIAGGTLQLANALALQNSTLNYSSGTLDFGALTAATLGGLSGSQNLTLLNGSLTAMALTVGNNNGSSIYSGALSDTGTGASLIKTGAGTLTLTGNNSYTGNTTGNGGTVEISTGGAINGAALAGAGFLVDGGTITCSANTTLANANDFLETAGSVTAQAFNGMANADGALIKITGGYFSATSVSMQRTASFSTAPTATTPIAASTTTGFIVNSTNPASPAVVNLGTIAFGNANSSSSMLIDGTATVTVTNELEVGAITAGSSRWSILQVNGGVLNSLDTVNGIVLSQNGAAAADNAEVYLSGGTTTANIINFGLASDTAGGQGWLIMNNAASLYLGSGGIVLANAAGYSARISLLGGTLGATADWSSTIPMQLSGTSFTIQAADASSGAHNISLSGGLSGSAALVKTGGGTLTLGGPDSNNGLTTISNGTVVITTAHAGFGDFILEDGTTLGVSNILTSGISADVGNLTLGNDVGPTTLSFANVADLVVPVLDASGGTINLNGNCTIKLADAVNLTAPNEYPLLKYSTIVTNSGTGFSLSLPPGVSGRLTNDASVIALVVTGISAAAPSTISSIVVSGNNLVLNATGGSPGAPVNILTTTNIALPLIEWTTNSTTAFDGSGNLVNYNLTGAINSGKPQQYYRLQQ